MKTIHDAAAFLRQHDNYLIMTHRRPDGDAVGSAAALCLGLRALGKSAEVFPNPQFTGRFAPLLEGLLGTGDPTGRTVIAVDLADEKLLPYNAPGMAGKIAFSMDHHPSNTGYAPHSLVAGDAAACGEIVLDVLTELKVTLTEPMATALYIAISTDTGCFRFTNVTAATYRAAARCKDAGAETELWNRLLFSTKSRGRLSVETYLYKNADFYMDGKVAVCLLPQAVAVQNGATEDDLDNISDYPREIAGVEIAIVLREVKDGAKISIRTFDPWDASFLCSLLGGGGHKNAAGATVPGTLQDGKAAILDAMRRAGYPL